MKTSKRHELSVYFNYGHPTAIPKEKRVIKNEYKFMYKLINVKNVLELSVRETTTIGEEFKYHDRFPNAML